MTNDTRTEHVGLASLDVAAGLSKHNSMIFYVRVGFPLQSRNKLVNMSKVQTDVSRGVKCVNKDMNKYLICTIQACHEGYGKNVLQLQAPKQRLWNMH